MVLLGVEPGHRLWPYRVESAILTILIAEQSAQNMYVGNMIQSLSKIRHPFNVSVVCTSRRTAVTRAYGMEPWAVHPEIKTVQIQIDPPNQLTMKGFVPSHDRLFV